jgi:glucosylglycerate synthase
MAYAPLPKALRDEIGALGKADIMVGIPSFKNAATIGYVVRAAQAGLVQYFPDLRPVVVNADAGSPDATQRVVVETEPPDYVERILLVRPRNRLQRISLTYPEVDGVGGKGAALLTIFRIAHELEVQALVVVDSDLRSIVPEWIELLAGPILKGGFDFVAPLYSRYKYDGTITNTVTYPLLRSLFGLRIRQPIGGDFGVSSDLIGHYLTHTDDWTADVSKFGVDIWMTTSAIAGGFAVCQTRLGAKVHDPKDPGADLGPMFSQVVSTLLRLTEHHAQRWLTVQGSHDVPVYGFERLGDPPPLQVNVARLLDEFGKGRLTVGEEWAAALAPETFATVAPLALEAASLAERAVHADPMSILADASFSFPDETWAHVVYDTCLAHHAGRMSTERLVAALVPLYFGRVASLILETREQTSDQAEAAVERQAKAFELAKPYLVSRWLASRPTARADDGRARNGRRPSIPAEPGPASEPPAASAQRRSPRPKPAKAALDGRSQAAAPPQPAAKRTARRRSSSAS